MQYHYPRENRLNNTLTLSVRRTNTHAGVDTHEEEHEEEQDTPQGGEGHQGQRLGVDDEGQPRPCGKELVDECVSLKKNGG